MEHSFIPKESYVVVDCRYGSSIGSYTIIAFKPVDPMGKVISIEPILIILIYWIAISISINLQIS